MGDLTIEGVSLKTLKKISNPKGDILHALKKSDIEFSQFGEAYFSIINLGQVKGWKKHTKQISNLVVPVGEVTFVIYDNRKESKSFNKFIKISLSSKNYKRLTIKNGLWVAFKGTGIKKNIILNIASIEHTPSESENKALDKILYDWSSI